MLRFNISNERQRREFTHDSGPLELGRGPQREIKRFIIEDRFVSRDQVCVESLAGGRVRLLNIGGPLTLSDGSTIDKGDHRDLFLPVRLTVGYTMVEITDDTPHEDDSSPLHTISRPLQSMVPTEPQPSIIALGEAPSADVLAEWFETLLTVQRAAAGSGEFYAETARAVVELVGLDRGSVLLRRGDDWRVVATRATGDEPSPDFSRRVLSQVIDQQRTFFQGFDAAAWSQSLVGVESVVASPIFDEHRNLVGAVYGSRSLRSASGRRGIQPLEAQVVQLLAAAVSAGLGRVQREAEAARNRIQFEQFVSPEVAQALEQNPRLLEGHENEVTVMFIDIRGFSRISERLGARTTDELLGDVMDALTDRIMDRSGTIIDYAGDGIASMWNDPIRQEHHAAEACTTALEMLAELPAINAKWEQVLGFPLQVGIGINTGKVQVGNAGSRRRRKYGPRGHTVNLGSRIEGATKRFGVPLLISGSTRAQIPDSFITRRLCRVRVVGIDQPVEIYELKGERADPCWLMLRDGYEKALCSFETGAWSEACQLLDTLQKDLDSPVDIPCQVLAQHATQYATCPPPEFDPVFDLQTK